ncbi:hypothetical protein [Brevundimonas sp. SORGH_AS_0993]|uniref:hypothetical protein n=1 Tax=Brevundimonas sp. SORGH_AS_0993 TaxID=3041794 RepID=UPI002781E530|nr:hypothetical protein [Brevundimonas sp. SORGH_AS_0993]MDQ1154217.1 hypothetical protein [Brevundimonas sp. SORGH_AS_0993]
MIAEELMARIGRLALQVEEGRRPPQTADQLHDAMDDLNAALGLPPLTANRQALLERVEAVLRTLESCGTDRPTDRC